MIRKIWLTGQYLRYLLQASSKFGVHSPFVYEFYTSVILGRNTDAAFPLIEKRREYLLRQRNLIEITDFGAAAAGHAYRTRFRRVNTITRKSSMNPRLCRLLYRLVKHSAPAGILEIGTAMGISTLYMAAAAPGSRIVTMEGCAVIAEKAMEGFRKTGFDNIEMITGNFDHHLGAALEKFDRIDFVLIDGNHRKEPTISYLMKILPKLHEGSVVVIDDIHWSGGMLQAWNVIRNREEVSVSIDLFRMGILLFRDDIARENHILRF
jgi:predicted O-methyltransferase YrrM